MITPGFTDDELMKLQQRANREFYFNPSRIADYAIHHPGVMFKMAITRGLRVFHPRD